MESNQKSELMVFIVKALIVGVIATLSIGGGIYVGTAYSFGDKSLLNIPKFVNDSYLVKGEKFPNYDLYNLNTTNLITTDELTTKEPTLLLFLSNNCSACTDILNNWEKYVFKKIDPSITIAFVFDNETYQNISDVDEEFLKNNAMIFVTNRVEQIPIDGFFSTPTIVGVNKDSKISFISSGYDKRIDAQIINELLLK